MRVIFFIFFCIFSFSSSNCINFEYLGNKWKQTDGAGKPIQNSTNHQQIEITTENLYHYLISVGITHLLTNIAEHLVNKGHYGYLPLKPFAHDHRRGVGRRGGNISRSSRIE